MSAEKRTAGIVTQANQPHHTITENHSTPRIQRVSEEHNPPGTVGTVCIGLVPLTLVGFTRLVHRFAKPYNICALKRMRLGCKRPPNPTKRKSPSRQRRALDSHQATTIPFYPGSPADDTVPWLCAPASQQGSFCRVSNISQYHSTFPARLSNVAHFGAPVGNLHYRSVELVNESSLAESIVPVIEG